MPGHHNSQNKIELLRKQAEELAKHHPGFPNQFNVADTGIGIPEDQHGHIFENFTRVDSSEHMQFQGSGLGLAICKPGEAAMIRWDCFI
jgi:signal transduction histidine kinase